MNYNRFLVMLDDNSNCMDGVDYIVFIGNLPLYKF